MTADNSFVLPDYESANEMDCGQEVEKSVSVPLGDQSEYSQTKEAAVTANGKFMSVTLAITIPRTAFRVSVFVCEIDLY